MNFKETNLKDCYIIEYDKFCDDRGYFCPYFIQPEIKSFGLDFNTIVQCNRSKSSKGVVRGFHFQHQPKAQAKIVEVIAGAALDIIVDIRKDSPTFKQYVIIPLSADDNKLLYVPKGFAHGFISLQDNTIFQYLVDNDYAPDLEDGISLDDEELNINWKSILKEYNIDYITTSEKDKHYIPFKNRELIF